MSLESETPSESELKLIDAYLYNGTDDFVKMTLKLGEFKSEVESQI